MENLAIYNQVREVPKEAQKSFSNGKFSGTDINPMWRIKKLTEMFGPVGFGWYTEVTRQETIPADDGNIMVFVDINLFVKDGDTWSKPIFGTGGNTLKTKGKGDDDGFKKAYTDALSIACKALGIGADIWYSADVNADFSSKYADLYTDGTSKPASANEPTPRTGTREAAQAAGQRKLEELNTKIAEAKMQKCTRCQKPITDATTGDGQALTAAEIIARSKQAFGSAYCWECSKVLSAQRDKHEGDAVEMAAPGQVAFMKANMTPEELKARQAKFGEELEKMTRAEAEKMVAALQKRIAKANAGH